MIDPESTIPGPDDTFRSVQVFTNLEKRGMEIFFCKLEGFNGVVTKIEQVVFIPESDLEFISTAAGNVAAELKNI